jgi:hypothetical protein
MRAVTALIITLIALGAPATAAAPTNKATAAAKKGEFSSSESILRWINGYRLKPEPAKAPAAARAMSELNLFRDLETAGVYVGFLAGVLETNPKKAEELIAKMFPMPPEDQVVIVRAIAYSNLPEWKALLLKFAERMPARQGLIDRFVHDKMPTSSRSHWTPGRRRSTCCGANTSPRVPTSRSCASSPSSNGQRTPTTSIA